MLVHRPQFHAGMRMGVLDLMDLVWERTLKGFLLNWIGLVVTRTRYLEREAHPLEILPATLGMNLASNLLAHTTGHFGATPQAAICTLAASQQPDHLQVTAFDGINRLAVSLLQLIRGEMGSDLHVFWHYHSSGQITLPEEILFGLASSGELSREFD